MRRPAARTESRRGHDDGFSLVEVLVALAIMSVVMVSLSAFLVNSMAVTHRQGHAQVAAQMAMDASETVRRLNGATLATGRDRAGTDVQWSQAVPAVADHLRAMQKVWDDAAPAGAGRHAALPTRPAPVYLNDVQYLLHWYLGGCWQVAAVSGGDCSPVQTPTGVPFFRVVIAVTWPEATCAGGTCSYVTSVLISSDVVEPAFN